jgi:hypothetical protein
MKKAADPVMADYAKEIAPRKSTTRSIRCSSDTGPARERLLRRSFLWAARQSGVAQIHRRLLPAAQPAAGLSVAILIVPVTIQMISRFTALIPPGSGPKVAVLFIWMVMLGAMIGVRDVALRMRRVARAQAAPQRIAARRLHRLRAGVRTVFVWYGIKVPCSSAGIRHPSLPICR